MNSLAGRSRSAPALRSRTFRPATVARSRCTKPRRPHGEQRRATMSTAFDGAIFDIDGVLVDSPHERAWRESLRELMEGDWREIRDRTSWSPEGFTPEVYGRVMSGKPRMSGAHAALDYFHVPDVDRRAVAYA